MILFGYTDNKGILLGNGALVFRWYVVSIDTGHIAQSPQSSPKWSPAFKMEPVLSVSFFISSKLKKAEHQRIDAFELWCWRRLLRVPWTAR